jgi:hypothetical protein
MSDKQRIAATIILDCGTAGVSMTPLAGTVLGWIFIAVASVATGYLVWTLISPPVVAGQSQNVNISPPVLPSAAVTRWLVITPTFLLFVMAGVWSWYGGLPALLQISKQVIAPARITSMERTAYHAGAPIMANLYIKNETTQPITMVGKSRFVISTGLPSKMQDLRKVEEEHWAAFKQWATSSDHIELTIPPLKEIITTLKGPSLTEQHVSLLNGNGNAAVYFMGIVTYTEPNGNSVTEEFCGFFTADPPRLMMLCAKHNVTFQGM